MLLELLLLLHSDPIDPPGVYRGRLGELDVRIPRQEAETSVDGKLDEAVWSAAAMLTDFSQFSPTDGVPAADSTQVLVWYSPTAIHFGIRAFEAHGPVHATLADRDRIAADDHIQTHTGHSALHQRGNVGLGGILLPAHLVRPDRPQ